MTYTAAFRKRAAKEYIASFKWYREQSVQASDNFVTAVNKLLAEIEKQPDYFRNSYKNFHEAKIKKFPISLIYFIDEEEKRVVITSFFHYKRNPLNKFKK
jgi:mRNA-degrading endonuclease RelE of RelBE toxin-antitoxin system